MKFEAKQREPKATLEIGDKTYKFYGPTVSQKEKISTQYREAQTSDVNITTIMKEYLSSLSDMPVDELAKLDNELFDSLFEYVTAPVKKT